MKFIAHGDIYDYPMAECDLDALILGVAFPNMIVDTFVALAHLLGVPLLRSDVERNLLPWTSLLTHVHARMLARGSRRR